MANILIADDEKEIIKLLRIYLEKDGVKVFEAYDGEMAFLILKNYPIDLAIVDINMPRMNGYELIKKVRTTMDIPIMVISAKVGLSDRVLGLDLGADDYITKPFEPLEVAAKVKARLRRMSPDLSRGEAPIITVGDLALNVSECRLDRNGEAADLTKVEFLVLKMFMESPGRVFTKEQVYENGWGNENAVDDNTIRVIISRLRDKIGEDKITTIRGLGCRLEKNG
jgi:DNA-binding response OmpR family regulator